MTTTFAQAMTSEFKTLQIGVTENGAVSLPSSQPPNSKQAISGRLDLFFRAVRGMEVQSLETNLSRAWQEDPLDTLKIIFHTRDCRGGKGERLLFRRMLNWLSTHHPQIIAANLPLIPELGRWDDLFFVPGGLEYMAQQLQKDLTRLQDPNLSLLEKKVSLAAKWAPSEHHSLDRDFYLVDKIVKILQLSPGNPIAGRAMYRRQFLTPLRQHLKIVERAMCLNQWSGIQYSHVPSRAMKNYRKAFDKHDKVRFEEWKTALTNKTKDENGQVAKVNAKQLFPHELVNVYLDNMYHKSKDEVDVVIEEQWKVLQQQLQEAGHLERSVCLCDVSGSMNGVPMQVSVALGLLISSVTAEPFRDLILTFDTNPQFYSVQGDSLCDRVKKLAGAPWGGSTNLQKAFDLILKRAQEHQLTAEQMPTRFYLFSDMQFNEADRNFTNFETINAKYRQSGYARPEIIFWNLRASVGTEEMPVHGNEPGVALVSGFSTSHMKSLLSGQDLTPWTVVRGILDSARYAQVTTREGVNIENLQAHIPIDRFVTKTEARAAASKKHLSQCKKRKTR